MKFYNLSGLFLLLCSMVSSPIFAKPAQDSDDSGVVAKLLLDVEKPQCSTIVRMYDSSYIPDALPDTIASWTINWGDKSRKEQQSYEGKFPEKAEHMYSRNGYFMITLKVKTRLGAENTDSFEIYIPRPIPSIAPIDKRDYCLGEKIIFKNTSQYESYDSSIWIWDYGTGAVSAQYETITPLNDTMNYRYEKDSTYNVFLYQFYSFNVGMGFRRCTAIFPDTSAGDKLFSLRVINCFQDDIEAIVSPKIFAFPNPAHHFINVSCTENTSFSIMNSLGQIVNTSYIERGESINIEHLIPGIYLLQSPALAAPIKILIE